MNKKSTFPIFLLACFSWTVFGTFTSLFTGEFLYMFVIKFFCGVLGGYFIVAAIAIIEKIQYLLLHKSKIIPKVAQPFLFLALMYGILKITNIIINNELFYFLFIYPSWAPVIIYFIRNAKRLDVW
jgi:hypothetical protein